MIVQRKGSAQGLSDRDFHRVARRIESMAGIVLEPHKRQMLAARLARRMQGTRHPDVGAYLDAIERGADQAELQGFVDALTTNQTGMFREPHHFVHLEQVIAARDPRMPLRIWSAGCSSGEEPYSVALTVMAALGRIPEAARILATDIDSGMIARARRGMLPAASCLNLEPRFATLIGPADGASRRMPAEAMRTIRFRLLNLLEPWPMRCRFDAIFCRNVMIYFSAATRAALIDRLAARLAPGGFLYLGHAESLLGRHPMLRACGRTVYRLEEAA